MRIYVEVELYAMICFLIIVDALNRIIDWSLNIRFSNYVCVMKTGSTDRWFFILQISSYFDHSKYFNSDWNVLQMKFVCTSKSRIICLEWSLLLAILN